MNLVLKSEFENLETGQLEQINGGEGFLGTAAIITAGVGLFKLGLEVGRSARKSIIKLYE